MIKKTYTFLWFLLWSRRYLQKSLWEIIFKLGGIRRGLVFVKDQANVESCWKEFVEKTGIFYVDYINKL